MENDDSESGQRTAVTLESLIEQITDDNRHGEIGTGPRVGKEVW